MGRFTSRPQGTPRNVRASIAAKQTVKSACLTWTSSAFPFSGSRVAVATYSSVRLSRFKSHHARLTRGSPLPACSRETCPHPTTSITWFTMWGHVALFAHYVGVSRSSAVLMMWCHSSRGAALTRLNGDRKSTRLNSSHGYISYAVFCLKKKKIIFRLDPALVKYNNDNQLPQRAGL